MYGGDRCTSSCRWYAGDVTRAVGEASRSFSRCRDVTQRARKAPLVMGMDVISKRRARAVSFFFTLSA